MATQTLLIIRFPLIVESKITLACGATESMHASEADLTFANIVLSPVLSLAGVAKVIKIFLVDAGEVRIFLCAASCTIEAFFTSQDLLQSFPFAFAIGATAMARLTTIAEAITALIRIFMLLPWLGP